MSNQAFNQTRRHFIKGAVYSSVLAASGLGLQATASEKSALPLSKGAEWVDFVNHTASPVVLNAHSDALAPGAHRAIAVPALSSNDHRTNNKSVFITDVLQGERLAIQSDYPEFNGVFSLAELS